METANLVLVVDEDAAMLRSLARLRQFGYATLLFPSAEASKITAISTRQFASFSTSTWAMFQASS